jgi:hypothetical protein
MAIYEDGKFIVINTKYLKDNGGVFVSRFLETLPDLNLPINKYYVVNQDEEYASEILKLILKGEDKKEELEKEKLNKWKIFKKDLCNTGEMPDDIDWKRDVILQVIASPLQSAILYTSTETHKQSRCYLSYAVPNKFPHGLHTVHKD